MSLALRADAFDEGVLDVVDLRVVEGGVVDQNLHGVRAPVHDALHGNVRQQVGQAAGLGVVVAALLVGQQQAGVGGARFGGGQAELRIEQDGAGMRRQNLADRDFEFAHHLVGDLIVAMPRAAASDFCRLPRWSMAAAAMTPSLFESAFRWRIFPSDKLTKTPLILLLSRTGLSPGSTAFSPHADSIRRLRDHQH